MKNTILTVIILLCSFQISAQTYDKVIPIEESQNQTTIKDGTYFKDIHHVFDQYIGTWEGTLAGRTYRLVFRKQTRETDYMAQIKDDYLTIDYRILQNGRQVINTFIQDKGWECVGTKLFDKGDHLNYYFAYSGKENFCGQTGDLLVQTTDDPNELRLKLYPDGEPISDKECPNGEAEQVFPTEDWLVLHKKK